MSQPLNHPTFTPNYRLEDLPYMTLTNGETTYREAMENERPQMRWNSIVVALAMTIGAVILGLAFWPAIAEFFTPTWQGLGFGVLLGWISGIGLLTVGVCLGVGQINRMEQGEMPPRIDPETVKACASAQSIVRMR